LESESLKSALDRSACDLDLYEVEVAEILPEGDPRQRSTRAWPAGYCPDGPWRSPRVLHLELPGSGALHRRGDLHVHAMTS
jgi:hypothetical protein